MDLKKLKEQNKENKIFFQLLHKSFFKESFQASGKEETTENISLYLN